MKIPASLKFGSVSFKLFTTSDGRVGFRHKSGSRWKQVLRGSVEELRSPASDIARALLNGETDAESLSAAQRRIYTAADVALSGTGIAVDDAARQVAEAWRITGGRASIADMARFYALRNPQLAPAPGTLAIVAELIADMQERGRSMVHRSRVESDLKRFAAAHPDLTTCTEQHVTAYLRAFLVGGRGRSQRRRDNVRDTIVRLFRFARSRHWLPPEHTTAAERVSKIAGGVDSVAIYTPAEIALILAHARPEWLPFFAIGAFAGLRNSEILRLEWSAVNWEHKVIAVKRSIARKIRTSRHAPLLPNLAAWLADYREKAGPLYRYDCENSALSSLSREIERLEKKIGIRWKKNALRHSYGSYRLALIKNPAQLALEMGNSPAQIREHYHDPQPEAVAQQWFGHTPDAANVLHLPLRFHTQR